MGPRSIEEIKSRLLTCTDQEYNVSTTEATGRVHTVLGRGTAALGPTMSPAMAADKGRQVGHGISLIFTTNKALERPRRHQTVVPARQATACDVEGGGGSGAVMCCEVLPTYHTVRCGGGCTATPGAAPRHACARRRGARPRNTPDSTFGPLLALPPLHGPIQALLGIMGF